MPDDGDHFEQIKELAKTLSKLEFIKQRGMDKEGDLLDIAMNMTLEEFQVGQNIVKFGEIGHKFYMILKGSVGIFIPDRIEVDEDVREERQQLARKLKNDIGRLKV